jgi:hypothetical protein
MAILDVVKGAATVVGLDVPTQVYGATTREMVEMQELANVMAAEIADDYDWQKLLILKTFDRRRLTSDFESSDRLR